MNYQNIEKVLKTIEEADSFRKSIGLERVSFGSYSSREKKIVALANLNYQVENGGFFQWVINGYCNRESFNALNALLFDLNTSESLEVLKMIEKVAGYVNLNSEKNGCFANYWKEKSFEEDEENYGVFEDITNRYYEINDILLTQIDSYLEENNDIAKVLKEE